MLKIPISLRSIREVDLKKLCVICIFIDENFVAGIGGRRIQFLIG